MWLQQYPWLSCCHVINATAKNDKENADGEEVGFYCFHCLLVLYAYVDVV